MHDPILDSSSGVPTFSEFTGLCHMERFSGGACVTVLSLVRK
jgi:hypothetical protein